MRRADSEPAWLRIWLITDHSAKRREVCRLWGTTACRKKNRLHSALTDGVSTVLEHLMVWTDVLHTRGMQRPLFVALCCTARKTTSIVRRFRHCKDWFSQSNLMHRRKNIWRKKRLWSLVFKHPSYCVYGCWIDDSIREKYLVMLTYYVN